MTSKKRLKGPGCVLSDEKQGDKATLSERLRQCEKWLLDPDKLARRKALDFLQTVDGSLKKDILIKALSYNGAALVEVIMQLEEIRDELDEGDYIRIADLLRVQKPEIRTAAVQVLSMADSDMINEILIEHLDEEKNPEVVSEIIDALWRMELRRKVNRSFKELIVLLDSGNQVIRDATIEHLKANGTLLSKRELVLIGDLLAHEDREIRLSAVKALDRINRPSKTSILLTWYIIKEEDEEVQRSMLAAMRDMRARGIEDVDQQLHCLAENPNFAPHREYIEAILDDTIPASIPPDAVRLKVNATREEIFELVPELPPDSVKLKS